MKLPQTPSHHRGKQASAARPGVFRGAHATLGTDPDTGRPRRFRRLSAALAVAALVLMGATPAMAEGEPVDPAAPAVTAAPAEAPPADAPVAEAPAPAAPAAEQPAPQPAPVAPAAPAAEPAPEPAPAAPSEATPAAEEADPASAAAEQPAPPYLRWRVADDNDALVGDVSLTIEGPRNDAVADDGNDNQWQGVLAATVKDNTGQPDYVGADLDADAGMFLVKTVSDDLDPEATHDVAVNESYRARPSTAPEGFAAGEDAEWLDTPVAEAADEAVPDLVLTAPAQQRAAEEEVMAAAADDELISPLALNLTPNCGTGAGCARLTITNVISGVGGPGTPSSWALTATRNNSNLDSYNFTSGTFGTVPRNTGPSGTTQATIYTLSAVASPAIQAEYTTTFNCAAGTGGTSSSQSNRTVTYSVAGNGDSSGRAIICTFTHTLVGKTTLRVKKVGDRAGTAGLANGVPLAGATFTAYASTTANPAPTGPALGTCTTVATGLCDIVVPNSYGNVWVVETGAPAGFRNIPAIGTGDYQNAKTVTPYQFRVALATGSTNATKNVTTDKNLPDSTVSGAWVNARNNPEFPSVCGVSIALVFDTSASISAGEMTQFKDAAKAFVGNTALGGTPSQVSMFSFDTTAQTMNGGAAYQLVTAGSGNTGYVGAQSMIQSGLPAQGTSDGYTNWDDALRLVKDANPNFDMVLFMTDGDPTAYGNGASGTQDTNVQFRSVEEAMLSANALKNEVGPGLKKTKIVGVGVGLSTNSDLNLAAVTGPLAGTDYFNTNFGGLDQTLRDIATKNCAGTLTVIKRTVDAAGQQISASDAGWGFTASGDVVNGSPASQTTTTSGTNFALTFNDLNQHTISVNESSPKPGFVYQGTTCTNADGAVIPDGNGFKVPVRSGKIVSCTVTNKQVPQEATVQANKTWVIKDKAGNTLKTYTIPQGSGEAVPSWLVSSPTIQTVTNPQWGNTYPGFIKGQLVNIGESASIVTANHPGCTLTSKLLTSANGQVVSVNLDGTATYPATLVVGANTYGVTNTVTCDTQVTWSKVAEKDTSSLLSGSEWKLTGPGQPPTTGTPVTDCVGATVAACSALVDKDPVSGQFKLAGLSFGTYTLTETKAPPGYVGGASFSFTVSEANVGSVIVHGPVNNTQQPSVALPLTGGMSSEMYTLWGTGIGLLAALMGVVYWRRFRGPVMAQ